MTAPSTSTVLTCTGGRDERHHRIADRAARMPLDGGARIPVAVGEALRTPGRKR